MLVFPPPSRFDRRRPAARVKSPLPPVDVNVTRVLVLASGAILVMFDGPVIIDMDHPPTTWTFNGIVGIVPGAGLNFGDSAYFVPTGPVNPGDPAVFGADDPAARTPDGGFVNGGTVAVADL